MATPATTHVNPSHFSFGQGGKQEGQEEGRLDHPQGAEQRPGSNACHASPAAAAEAAATQPVGVAGEKVCGQPAGKIS